MEQFAAKRQALLAAGVDDDGPRHRLCGGERPPWGPARLLLPGTILRGSTVVGANCEIGPKHHAGGLHGGGWGDHQLLPVQRQYH